MELSYIEAWVRLLRLMYAKGRGGTERTMPVQVNIGFPFADSPENANLPNNPAYASATSSSLTRTAGRREVSPPEISVHDGGASFPKKYMDNFLGHMYARDVVLPADLCGKVSLVKNVMIEKRDGTLRVLTEGQHYKFDEELNVITFLVEFFDYAPMGATVQYTCELYSETLCGQNELILSGQITKGETIGSVYSLEGDITVQIDFWGADPKQTEWMLQRFRNLWINERKLRRSLAAQGLITLNLSWNHGGTVKSLDKNLRPYLYNISSIINFSTEYRVLELAEKYVADFEGFSAGSNWLGTISPSFEAEAIREVKARLVLEPFKVRMMIPWGGGNKLLSDGSYGIHNTLGQFSY